MQGKKQQTTTTVYLFMYHPQGLINHSFYAIDIPNLLQTEPKPASLSATVANFQAPSEAEPVPLSPILEFSLDDYPEDMCCIKFCSNVYFLGGRFPLCFGYSYTPQVHIFDPSSATIGSSVATDTPGRLKEGVPMTSGKPWPYAFVADHKIFVIGSNIFERPISLSVREGFKLFEAFDPTTNKWTVLKDPPVDHPTLWVGSFIMKQKVFILGLQGLACSMPWCEDERNIETTRVFVAFDLQIEEWTALPEMHDFIFDSPCGLVEDSLYGLLPYPNSIGKLGPLPSKNEKEVYNLHTLPMQTISLDVGFKSMTITRGEGSSRFLFHLGNRHFCNVSTWSLPCESYYDGLHPGKRLFWLSIFKDITENIIQSGSSSFEGKLLYSATYKLETEWEFDTSGILRGCFPLHPEEKKKKKKKKNKNKKFNKNKNFELKL